MTYAEQESSVELGRPVELYVFTMGATVWRYVSADEDMTVGEQTYIAVQITNDGVKQTGQATSDAMNITAQSDIGPAAVYTSNPPITPIAVSILRMHEGVSVPIINYVGEVSQVNMTRPGQVKITCQTMSASMRRQGLRLSWQRSCPHTLYDHQCRVNKTLHAIGAVVRSITGFVVVLVFDNPPTKTLAGGFAEWVDDVKGYQSITIESQVNGVSSPTAINPPAFAECTMFDDTSDMYIGMRLTVYPGCASTEASCRSFGNILNYGGFKNMPGKSPFDGLDNPVF